MPSMTAEADNVRASLPPRVGDCSHRMRVVGSVHQGTATRLDCERPLRAVCRDGCGHQEFWRCDSYGCGPCGDLKRRRLHRLVDNGAAIHLSNGFLGYFLTLTAPGSQDHRRWYQGKRPRERQECGCHRHGMTDGVWNAQESKCWNRLRTALTRDREVIFAGAVETQHRGMLHRHVLLFSDREMLHEEVQALALAAGYGCVLDLEPVKSVEKAARYIAKYVTKSSGERFAVPWERVDPETGELVGKRATYRLWSSSRRWGITMREIRAVQSAQARARARYLSELQALLASEAGSLAPESAGHVHMTGLAPP